MSAAIDNRVEWVHLVTDQYLHGGGGEHFEGIRDFFILVRRGYANFTQF